MLKNLALAVYSLLFVMFIRTFIQFMLIHPIYFHSEEAYLKAFYETITMQVIYGGSLLALGCYLTKKLPQEGTLSSF